MFEKKSRGQSRKAGHLTQGILLVLLAVFCIAGCAKSGVMPGMLGSKIVGKNIKTDQFQEFYYTWSKTVNPPEFQRYRFFVEDGKAYFYHEKREGDTVFLTEEDITVSGTKELTEEEWNRFWGLMEGGSVENRKDNANAGGGGPWLYLYWDGDKGKCQEFSFRDYKTLDAFEDLCIELKDAEMK